MEPKTLTESTVMPSAELAIAINRINDVVGRIHSVTEHFKKINDKLYGPAPECGKEMCPNEESPSTLKSLTRVIEAAHDACSDMNEQMDRQGNLV